MNTRTTLYEFEAPGRPSPSFAVYSPGDGLARVSALVAQLALRSSRQYSLEHRRNEADLTISARGAKSLPPGKLASETDPLGRGEPPTPRGAREPAAKTPLKRLRRCVTAAFAEIYLRAPICCVDHLSVAEARGGKGDNEGRLQGRWEASDKK